MNRTQFFGSVLVMIGLLLLIVLPFVGIWAGVNDGDGMAERLVVVSVFGGWAIVLLGAVVVVVSLVFERLKDMKKEKEYKEY